MNTAGNKKFQKFFAAIFLNGFKKEIKVSSSITKPTIAAIRASNLKPNKNAEPENALAGGLYFT